MQQKYSGAVLMMLILSVSSCSKKREIKRESFNSEDSLFAPLSVDELRGNNGSLKGESYVSEVLADTQRFVAVFDQQAKHADIPDHFDLVPNAAYCHENSRSIILSYTSQLGQQEVIAFYQKEMERLGWRKGVYFEGDESALTFSKPKRTALVLVRSHAKHSRSGRGRLEIVVFVEK